MTGVLENRACKNCHYVGPPKMPGSGWIEVVLWCWMMVPGLLYSIWRRDKNRASICPKCDSPNMVSLQTPIGQEIAGRTLQTDGSTSARVNAPQLSFVVDEPRAEAKQPAEPSFIIECLKWFFVFAGINGALMVVSLKTIPETYAGFIVAIPFVAIAVTYLLKKSLSRKR